MTREWDREADDDDEENIDASALEVGEAEDSCQLMKKMHQMLSKIENLKYKNSLKVLMKMKKRPRKQNHSNFIYEKDSTKWSKIPLQMWRIRALNIIRSKGGPNGGWSFQKIFYSKNKFYY